MEERKGAQEEKPPQPRMANDEWETWVTVLLLCIFVVWWIFPYVMLRILPDPSATSNPFNSTGYRVAETIVHGIVCLVAAVAVIRLGSDYQWTGFRERSLWDWLQLLIVPAVLAIGGLSFAAQQEERQQTFEDQRAQAIAYQAYIEQMSRLLTEEHLGKSPEDEVRLVARAQTLNVLRNIEAVRKIQLLPFLAENELIQGDNPIIDLATADFKGADFEGDDPHLDDFAGGQGIVSDALDGINLNRTQLDEANLNSILLRDARLNEATAYEATLIMANLRGAELREAEFQNADLSGANLDETDSTRANFVEADLSRASLVGADLSPSYLADSCLIGTDLRGANFSESVGLTNEQLQQTYGDEKTQIPEDLQRPEAWSKPIEEQRKGKELRSGIPLTKIPLTEESPCRDGG